MRRAALTDTGNHLIVPINDRSHPPETPRRLSASGQLYIYAGVLAAVGALAFVTYLLRPDWPNEAQAVLALVSIVAGVLVGVALIAGRGAHHVAVQAASDDDRLRLELAAVREELRGVRLTTAERRHELLDLPADVREQVTRQGEAYLAAAAEHWRAYEAGLDRLREEIDRLRRQGFGPDVGDEQDLRGDNRYLAGYADGLAGRALGDGNVVPINGGTGRW